jgi:hypothetical protein
VRKKAYDLVISIGASTTGEALALGDVLSYPSRPYCEKPGTPKGDRLAGVLRSDL